MSAETLANMDVPEVHWSVPVAGVGVYLFMNWALSGRKPEDTPSWVFPLSVVHNTVMTVFSGYVFFITMQFLLPRAFEPGFIYDPECKVLMGTPGDNNGSPLGYICFLFFVSKLYEFMDTWILLLKGKKTIFLQKYHHIGAALIMWGLTFSRTEASWIFLGFNSFIHTIMYFYYLLTCFGYRPKWKIILTSLQLTQFVCGLSLTIPYFMLDCTTGPSLYTLIANNAYVTILVFLFADFFKSTYTKPKSKKKPQ